MSRYLPIEELAKALLLANARRKLIVMLAAYFDASRTEKGHPGITVGGYVASVARWKTFESKWQNLLDKEGLPFFHMTDFEAYQGHYKGWTKKRHVHVMKKICRAINHRVDFSFARSVKPEDYAWAQKRNTMLQGFSPFTFCASQCLHVIAEWADRHKHTDPILYIFESGDGYNRELNELKDLIEGSERRMKRYRWTGLFILPKVMSNPPHPLLPLQAADVWAFECRKEWENAHAPGKRLRPVRKSAMALLKGIEEDCGFHTPQSLLTSRYYWE